MSVPIVVLFLPLLWACGPAGASSTLVVNDVGDLEADLDEGTTLVIDDPSAYWQEAMIDDGACHAHYINDDGRAGGWLTLGGGRQDSGDWNWTTSLYIDAENGCYNNHDGLYTLYSGMAKAGAPLWLFGRDDFEKPATFLADEMTIGEAIDGGTVYLVSTEECPSGAEGACIRVSIDYPEALRGEMLLSPNGFPEEIDIPAMGDVWRLDYVD